MADEDGLPEVGASARALGARPGDATGDIGIGPGGVVQPETGGMSVSPPPENLPGIRRPPEFGGTGKDPLFELETDDLPQELRYRPDPTKPDAHGFVEPSRAMGFEEYQQAPRSTRSLWRLVR